MKIADSLSSLFHCKLLCIDKVYHDNCFIRIITDVIFVVSYTHFKIKALNS